MVSDPVEGIMRRFDKFSDRKVISSKFRVQSSKFKVQWFRVQSSMVQSCLSIESLCISSKISLTRFSFRPIDLPFSI